MTQAVTLAGLGSTTPTIVSPTLTSPVLGTPVSGSLVNCTDVNYTGFKNRIINGGMVIDQRNGGAEVNPAVTQTYYLDRWVAGSTVASKFKIGQNAGAVTPPTGYTSYLGLTSLSAYTVGAVESYHVRQLIEGLNVSDLAWGTASAATVTVSFYVRSSLTGTFGGSLRNSDGSRSNPFTYTISVANTWEQKTVTIAGDTSGTWLITNGTGIILTFSIGTGATLSGPASAWAAVNYLSASGATSVVGTSGATFYITGVQLEKGSVATSFDYRPYGTELALCQRYAIKYTTEYLGLTVNNSTGYNTHLSFPVQMRATPTIDSGATYSVNSGSAGTVGFIAGLPWAGATSFGAVFGNVAGNWSTLVFVSLNAVLNSEL